MTEYILRDQAIMAVTGAKLPDVSASGRPIANGKRSVTDCVRRLKEIPAADVRPVVRGKWELSDDRCWHTCSICGADIDVSVGLLCYVDNEEVCTHNFCPNCGAMMEES